MPRSGAGRTGRCSEPHLGGIDEEPLTRVGLGGPGLGATRSQSWQGVIMMPSDRNREPPEALQLPQSPFVGTAALGAAARPHPTGWFEGSRASPPVSGALRSAACTFCPPHLACFPVFPWFIKKPVGTGLRGSLAMLVLEGEQTHNLPRWL